MARFSALDEARPGYAIINPTANAEKQRHGRDEKGFVILQLEGKSLRSDFTRFVTATTASLMVFSLYSMVDGLMVARGVGEYAMSAVNLALHQRSVFPGDPLRRGNLHHHRHLSGPGKAGGG